MVIRQAETKLDLCIKDKSLEPLKRALEQARSVQASVMVVHAGEMMEARLLAEQALEASMDVCNELRPPQAKKDITPLLECLEAAMELSCEPKKILKGQALRRTVEAELRLLEMHRLCLDIEVRARS